MRETHIFRDRSSPSGTLVPRAFTLLEMAIVLTLVGLALIPLYRWQSFVLLSLRLQDDSIEILHDIRTSMRQLERDVVSASRVVRSNREFGSPLCPNVSTTDFLVLYQQVPETLGSEGPRQTAILYGLGDGTHFSKDGTRLMRVSRSTGKGEIIASTQTLAFNAKRIQFEYREPGWVGIAFEAGIDFGEHSQKQVVRTAAAAIGQGK